MSFFVPSQVLADQLTGLDPEPEGFLESLKGVSLTRNTYVPPFVDLSPEMPPPVNQIHGSCVSYTVAYATLGYYVAQRAGSKPGDPVFTPSPAYLHTQIHNSSGPCNDSGANIAKAMDFLSSRDIPARGTVGDADICNPALKTLQAPRVQDELQGFRALYADRTDDDIIPSSKVTAIKQSLAAGYPLPTSFKLYCASGKREEGTCRYSLSQMKKGATYYGSNDPTTDVAGGHAMAVVGYDDARQAFKIQNSWGADFADDGFFWMDYDAFRSDVNYILKPVFESKPKTPNRPRPVDIGEVDIDGCHAFTQGDGAVSGFVASMQDRDIILAALSQKGLRAGQIDIRPWPVCAAMKTLQEPLLAEWKPRLRKLDGQESVAFGDSLAFEVNTAKYPSFLYMVYLQADGSVVNLVTRGGPTRQQHQPGRTLVFGDGQQGRQTYTATAPAGPEAVIAISSRSPIFELEALEDTHTGQFTISGVLPKDAEGATPEDQVFLTILSEALGAQPEPGNLKRSISADILHLTIKE